MRANPWRLAQTRPLPEDAQRFLDLLPIHAGWLDPKAPLVVARAPGRLDVMGGIADYSGSLVLELPLASAAFCAAQWTPEPACEARTTAPAELDLWEFRCDLPALLEDYDRVAARFAEVPGYRWAAYVLGSIAVVCRERGAELPRGVKMLVHSDVPAGKGLASSAALEVASLRALAALLPLTLEERELALLAQVVENRVALAPCGVMDQMTATCGRPDHLLALLCQPAEIRGHVRLPMGLEVWGIDSGLRHAVSGADYTSVRTGAFMGYRILADLCELPVQLLGPGVVSVEDWLWDGWLANVGAEAWHNRFRAAVPPRLRGADFLSRYGGITDSVTRVDPARLYFVRRPTEHPILEHARVCAWHDLLRKPLLREADLEQLGAWMHESHQSYSACGLGSDGTDLLVELVHQAGPATGLLGAKITGGGSGGTVAVLARRGSLASVRAVAGDYARRTGKGGGIFAAAAAAVPAFEVAELVPI